MDKIDSIFWNAWKSDVGRDASARVSEKALDLCRRRLASLLGASAIPYIVSMSVICQSVCKVITKAPVRSGTHGNIAVWQSLRSIRSFCSSLLYLSADKQDYISGFATNPAKGHLLATSGDGRLSAYELRKNVLSRKSDELYNECYVVCSSDQEWPQNCVGLTRRCACDLQLGYVG
ncbi:hypothetical protein PsorP6_009984 [Peronosclerospora sorghi]|uniref:Uncharacterized protein n=1 Tax=Peronosclerospora sorghi TaxID=230839 RepID=A0ACC0VYC6_9STRA|nr:hypothetical protein PsorP6_009984 [Peronosclerospora sorghi]